MRVAVHHMALVPPKGYGGIGRVVYYLCKGLSELGHKVYLIAFEGSHVPGCEVIGIPEELSKGVSDINLENPDISEFIPRCDILHVHYYVTRDYKVPVVKTIHGYPFHCDRWWSLGFPNVYDRWCIFLSDAHRRTAQRPRNPFVYNGIDVKDYRFSEEKEDYLLFLARVDWPVKGVYYAVEAAKKMKMPLTIAGNIVRKEFYKDFKRHIVGDIRYVGEVGGDVKMELLSKARALIFPTLWPEPFGLAVIEALACGTPVLTTYFGAMPEIVIQGKVGFMHLSLNELKEQVKMLDRIDPFFCRRYVEERFSHLKMARDYLKIYRERLLEYEGGYLQPNQNPS